MLLRYLIAAGLFTALAACATSPPERDILGSPPERDILDAALERPLRYGHNNNQPLRFGDPDLDRAEIALREYLPRPWTATRIHALFLAAYTWPGEAQKRADVRSQNQGTDYWKAQAEQFDEWEKLVEQLGSILAASRDPRAALALSRVIESPDGLLFTCGLAPRLMDYFGADSSYQRLPSRKPVLTGGGNCGDGPGDAHKWWLLNQRAVKQRAAAITAGLAPCARCEQEAVAAVDQLLRKRLHDRQHGSAPTLHLTVEGAGVPRNVQVSYVLRSTSGQKGAGGVNAPYSSPDIPLRTSSQILDRSDMQLSGNVISIGYRSVHFELDHINDGSVVPITLVPAPSKTLTGTVTFSSDSAPRPFRLRANLRDPGAQDPYGGPARNGMLLQNLDEVTVDQDGRFSITVPDVTQDPILSMPGSRYELAVRNNDWVLVPDVVALDHPPGTSLKIIVAPRPGTKASANAGNAGPLLPVTGRVIDADGRPVSAAQVAIVDTERLYSLRCPENGDACFPALQATGMARALAVSGNDGSFTLQVPVGLMRNDSVWAEGPDADGKSARTRWMVSNRSLPTSSLGDIKLDQRMDFTLVVRGDGKPISDAEVEFMYQGKKRSDLGTKRTDAAGAVELHEQYPGSYGGAVGVPFTVRAAGFASEAWDGAIEMGTTTQVIELEREAVQRGRVVDARGRALGNVTVQAHAVEQAAFGKGLHDPYPDEDTNSARADAAGTFTLRGLHGGREYRLVVISAEGAVTRGERVVTPGGAPVDIVVPAR